MRIGVDIRSLLEAQPSGVTEYTYQVIRHCIKQDADNTYLLFCNSRRGLPGRFMEDFRGANVTIIERRLPNKLLNASLFFLRRPFLDRWMGGVDLFFLPNLNFVSLSPRCKKVVMVHDVSFRYPGFYSLRSRLWHQCVRPRYVLQYADMILCPSQSTKNDIVREYHVDPRTIAVIPLAIDPRSSVRHPEEVLNQFRDTYNLHRPYILFLGTVEPRKNIAGMVQAWKYFRRHYTDDCELVIAGALKNRTVVAENQGLRFLGYIPPEDKNKLYQAASVFIYPSYFEGFGFPILEAMAAGVPVISGFATSLPEVAGDAALLVDPYNAVELAQGIHMLYTDESVRRHFITKGRERAAQFSWEKSAAATIELFNHIMRKQSYANRN